MSPKYEKFTNRGDVLSILALMIVSSTLFFVYPYLHIYYLSDIYVAVGMVVACTIISRKDEEYSKRVKDIIKLIVIGGLLTGIELTSIFLLMAYSSGNYMLHPFLFFIEWTGLIYLTILLIGGMFFVSLYVKNQEEYFSPQ